MRKRVALVVLALTAAVAAVALPAQSASQSVSGKVTIEGLTLAGTQYGTPSGEPTTETTDPLTIPVTQGDTFHYSTISCSNPFPPWNNVGLHFDPDYPGITDPASVRHELEGTVTRLTSANRGVVQGIIRTFLCVNGQRQHQIITQWKANFAPTSATSVALRSNPVPTKGGLAFDGGWAVIAGTGRFVNFRGKGVIKGQFTRLGTRPGTPESLSPPGYSEVPFRQDGRFTDDSAP